MPSYDKMLERLLDKTDQHVAVLDADGRFVWLNRPAATFLGRTAEDLVGVEIIEVVHASDRDRVRNAILSWIPDEAESRLALDVRLDRGDGQESYGRWSLVRNDAPGPQSGMFASYIQDITDSTVLTQRLARSESRMRSVLSGLLDGVVTIDVKGTIQSASKSMHRIFGWDPVELIGRNVNVLMPEPHHSNHDEYLAKYASTGETWILNTVRQFDVVRKDGSRFPCELSVSRVDVPDGGGAVFCGVLRDATDRILAARELEASERRFRAMFEQEHQLVLLVGPDQRIVECNPAVSRFLGLESQDSLRGSSLSDLAWWPDPSGATATLEDWFRRASKAHTVEADLELLDGFGTLRVADLSLKPVQFDENSPDYFLLEVRDITDVRRSQQRETNLLRTLAQLGESAAVLAHEIKNPITSIHVALRAVAHQLGQDEREALEDMASRLQALETTLHRTLSFTKPFDLNPGSFSVEAWIEDAVQQMLPEAELSGIRIDVDVEEGLSLVRADRHFAVELVVNLIRNAIDAIQSTNTKGGRIQISGETGDAGTIRLHVDDDGPGIDPARRHDLFRPFVTGKPQGTGIGLAVCRKIAEEHDAEIEVGQPALGGARFTLTWPTVVRPSA
tara:strand:+ start:32735 stop:34594 length:1860 start_codon:yes stop_codon:yes gene_type:complete